MRVVREPPEPKSWPQSIACTRCGALLEMELADVDFHEGQADGPYHGPDRFTVDCPCCKYEIAVTVEKKDRWRVMKGGR